MRNGARRHQLAKRVEDDTELAIVLPLQLREPARQIRMRRQDPAQAYERPDDLHVHLHRSLAAQYTRQHCNALLGKCPWCVASTAA
jgi:hypothetical protein